MLTAFSIPVLL